jgi:GNAT superfamily N-acetyltransferase
MIFEALAEAADAGELLLAEGGLCHFHRRKDGAVTIREIIILPNYRRRGLGRHLVDKVKREAHAGVVVAKCPADLPANAFWDAVGFRRAGEGRTRTGRGFTTWRWQASG